MRHRNKESSRVTIGLDLGGRYSHICVVDAEGSVAEKGRIATTSAALAQRFADTIPARIVIEVGTYSPWVERQLRGYGHEVLVANPRKLRLIYQSNNKNDSADAEHLARLGRMDPKLLSPIRHRGEAAQAHLAIIRSRDALIQARTKLVNHVRGSVKAVGGKLPSCTTPAFADKVATEIPDELRPALEPVLEAIGAMTVNIREHEKRIKVVAQRHYPEAGLLQQVTGVGTLTSLAYILTIDDPTRFKRSRDVGPYLGLVPRKSQSSDINPQLRISKTGDPYLRQLLVGSAHYILGPFGPDCDLRRHGQVLAARGGKNAKKRAVIAIARKLAVLLHHLWIAGEVYEPLRQVQPEVEPQNQAA